MVKKVFIFEFVTHKKKRLILIKSHFYFKLVLGTIKKNKVAEKEKNGAKGLFTKKKIFIGIF